MALDTTTLNNLNGTNKATSANNVATANANDASDRFLKLLVAQMKNQDPLNPMDNAQVTSQMAQINTVSGIEKLNNSVQSLSGQYTQMQTLQAAALVGHQVVLPGNSLTIGEGVAGGGFELAGAADAVKVEIMTGGGHVIDTLTLGAESNGQHGFTWDTSRAPAGTDLNALTFKVTATSGATPVTSTALMSDTVSAVNNQGDKLMLELARSGSVAYSAIKALN